MKAMPTLTEMTKLKEALVFISVTLDHRPKLKDRMDLVTEDERDKVRDAANLASKLTHLMQTVIDP